VLYGLYMICHSLYSIFFHRILELEREVLDGTFDKYLLRPVSPFVQFIGGDIQYVGLCDTLLGVLLIAAGLSMAQARWTVADYAWLAVFAASGGTVLTCTYLLIASVSFWVVKANALGSVLMQLLLLTQKYPITIFGMPFRVLVTGVVPIAFMNFYPAAMLLGKTDAPRWAGMVSPLVAAGLAVVAAVVWRRGVRRYGSSGS
nr:ABC-2 family transporter protein [Clostridia bacterium]